MKLTEFRIETQKRNEIVEITSYIEEIIARSNIKSGMAIVFIPHTTAGITVNENADPSVKSDFLRKMSLMIPENEQYTHFEGNSDSHIKTILTNPSQMFIIEDGNLMLGTWQGVYFCEYDGPRTRKVWVKTLEG